MCGIVATTTAGVKDSASAAHDGEAGRREGVERNPREADIAIGRIGGLIGAPQRFNIADRGPRERVPEVDQLWDLERSPARAAPLKVRTGHQPQNGQGARPHDAADAAPAGGPGHRV